MINLSHCNEWQHRCPETGLIFPWYTKSFLDELVTWDLDELKVLELGGGASTLWWNAKAGRVLTIESSREWAEQLNQVGYLIVLAETKDHYIGWAEGARELYDIVIIDGDPVEWRDACVQPALESLNPGGKLIVDNWMQESLGWLPSEETQRIVTALPHVIYSQIGHPDWKTLVATKP